MNLTLEHKLDSRHAVDMQDVVHAIEKFKEWYSYRFVGYLPSDWITPPLNADGDDVTTIFVCLFVCLFVG